MSTISQNLPLEQQLDYSGAAGGTPGEADPLVFGLPRSTWVKILVVAGLMVALFWVNLRRLWDKTNPFYGEANWQHALFIPLIGLYYLYLNRDALLKAPVKPALLPSFTQRHFVAACAFVVGGLAIWGVGPMSLPAQAASLKAAGIGLAAFGVLGAAIGWGLASLLGGMLLFAYGIWPGQNDFLKDLGMVLTLFGVVLTLCGWRVMQIAWFPIAYLVCGIPWPGLVYSWIAGPLQQLAAMAAVVTLRATGVDAIRGGTKIVMLSQNGTSTLNVAEACAGLRSLMTFITVGAAVAFLSSRSLWQKIVITVSAVPIAVFCNMMRVSGQGLLHHYVSPKLSESFAHGFVGLIMLIPAFFLILLVAWILDRLFIEEVDDKKALKAAAARPVAAKKAPAAAAATPLTAKPQAAVAAATTSSAPSPITAAPATPPPAGGSRVARTPPRPGMSSGRPAPVRKPPPPQGPSQQ